MELKNNGCWRQNSLLIYKYYLDLVYYTNTLCIKYPKSEKLALASETNNLYIAVKRIDLCFKEYNKKNKIDHLNNLDVELNLQKVYLRLAYKYKYISKQNYETWSKKITEICNMLGGWLKSCLTR